MRSHTRHAIAIFSCGDFPVSRIHPHMSGEELYNLYRAIRVQQGWEEWKWESLNQSQQLVWNHLATAAAHKLFRSVALPS